MFMILSPLNLVFSENNKAEILFICYNKQETAISSIF